MTYPIKLAVWTPQGIAKFWVSDADKHRRILEADNLSKALEIALGEKP